MQAILIWYFLVSCSYGCYFKKYHSPIQKLSICLLLTCAMAPWFSGCQDVEIVTTLFNPMCIRFHNMNLCHANTLNIKYHG
jgi:hypothetical protein